MDLQEPVGTVRARNGSEFEPVHEYKPGTWYNISLRLDAYRHRYDLAVTGMSPLCDLMFDAPVSTVERVIFRTGPERRQPTPESDPRLELDRPGADDPIEPSIYCVSFLAVRRETPYPA